MYACVGGINKTNHFYGSDIYNNYYNHKSLPDGHMKVIVKTIVIVQTSCSFIIKSLDSKKFVVRHIRTRMNVFVV